MIAQFDWKILGSKVRSYPQDTAAAEMIFADITAKSIARSVDVAVSSVVGFLALSGAYLKMDAFAQGAATGGATHDAALASAKMLMALITTPNAPPFGTSAPATLAIVEGMAGAILAHETASPGTTGMTQAVHDGLLALASSPQSWAEQNGWSGIDVHQVEYALSDNVQKDPALFPGG